MIEKFQKKHYIQKKEDAHQYKIPVITYAKDQTKRHFFFYFFPGVFINAGWYSEQQAQLDAMKQLLLIQMKLITQGCINKECPVCMEPLEVDLKKHATHVECTRKSEHMLHYKTCPLCRGTLERVHYLIVDKKIYYQVKDLYKKFKIGLDGEMFEPLQNKRYIEVLVFRKKQNNDKETIQKRLKQSETLQTKTQNSDKKTAISEKYN